MLVSKSEICKVAGFGLSIETEDDIYKVKKVCSICWLDVRNIICLVTKFEYNII